MAGYIYTRYTVPRGGDSNAHPQVYKLSATFSKCRIFRLATQTALGKRDNRTRQSLLGFIWSSQVFGTMTSTRLAHYFLCDLLRENHVKDLLSDFCIGSLDVVRNADGLADSKKDFVQISEPVRLLG